MAYVLTVQDLEAAKKHDTFHGEVITGKAGGLASGTNIDYSVNAVTGQTQKTLRKTLEDIGPQRVSFTFTTGGTFGSTAEAAQNVADGNWYSWGGTDFPHVVAPGTNPAAIGSGYVPRTDVVLRNELASSAGSSIVGFQQAGAGATPRTSQDKMREVISVEDFGVKSTNSSIQNDAAFLVAATHAGDDPLLVPDGIFNISSRDSIPASLLLFGHGRIRFDVWEVVRRFDGGTQKYSWPVYFAAQSDCHIYVDGNEVALTWLSDRTVQYTSAATPMTTNVVFRVYGATIHLGAVPTNPVLDSAYSEIPRDVVQAHGHTGINGRDSDTAASNASYGTKSLMSLTTGSNNTTYGNRAGASIKDGMNHVLMGFQAGHRIVTGEGNTGIGTIALEHLTDGQYNTAVGFNSQGSKPSGSNNTSFGAEALWSWGACNNNTAMGYRAMANGNGTGENNVAVGTFSQDFAAGTSNTSVGYRALNAEGGFLTGNDNVAIGAFAARHLRGAAAGCTVMGSLALNAETGVRDLTAIGFMSMNANLGGIRNSGVGAYTLQTNIIGNDNTAIGWSGLKTATGNQNTSVGSRTQEVATTGDNNTTLGFEAGRNRSTGSANTLIGTRAGREIGANNDNVAIGSDTLQFLTSGANNTALGRSALRLMQDTTNATTLTNATGVGGNARVSGSNQVQIGDSATTTYVFGTVQNRSDARDKTDYDDTVLGIEFIMGLRPVDGRWDMRDDYVEEYQVQVGIDDNAEPAFETRTRQLPKDGSKARSRKHHWFIAQEVKELCDRLGVDFGGYQDHSINGGCDVLSLGYDEFIPPTVKAVQQCWTRLDELEKRIAALEDK